MPSVRLTVVVGLLLASCRGGDGSSVIPLAEFTEQAQQAACSRAVRCGWFPDIASCKSSSTWKTGQLVASTHAGRVRYDGKAAVDCLRSTAAFGCNLTDRTDQPPACAKAFVGIVATGGACFVDDDCASGSCSGRACSPPAGCCAGTCDAEAPTRAPAGGGCYPRDTCSDGTYCDNSQGICVTGIVMGQPCDPTSVRSTGCLPPALCQPSDSPLGGTCVPPPAEGEPCDPASTTCNSSLDYCDGGGRCVPKLALGTACPDGKGCPDYAFCASGICVSRTRASDGCDDRARDACMGTLSCQAGTCTLPTQAICP